MTDVQENQRWKIDGDCSKCKRQRYCSKQCRLNRERRNAQIGLAMMQAMGKVMTRHIESERQLRSAREQLRQQRKLRDARQNLVDTLQAIVISRESEDNAHNDD